MTDEKDELKQIKKVLLKTQAELLRLSGRVEAIERKDNDKKQQSSAS
jgi:BMFP domain-containing protein YqiC